MLQHEDPRLACQEWILDRLDITDDGTVDVLRDLHHLAGWFRTCLRPGGYIGFGNETVEAAEQWSDGTDHIRRSETLLSAATATMAFELITADDPSVVARHAHQLLRRRHRHRSTVPTAYVKRAAVPAQALAQLSFQTRGRIFGATDQFFAGAERLRYRSMTPSPIIPDPASSRIAGDRARHIPQRLWPDWVARFSPPQTAGIDQIAECLPGALLLPGATASAANVTAELTRWSPNSHVTLNRLVKRHSELLPALCALAQYLDEHGSPIDYRRRRAAFTDVPMTFADWRIFCGRISERPGTLRRMLHARRYMLTLLTGTSLRDPGCPVRLHSITDKASYRQFEGDLSGRFRRALHHHATELLDQAGIRDEPLIWSPLADCVAGFTLPTELTDIDTAVVTRLIDQESLTIAQASARLNVTIERIQNALDQPHVLPTPFGTPAKGSRPLRAQDLTRAFFEREYVRAGKTLKEIRKETGVPLDVLSDAAAAAGISLTDERYRRARVPIDEAWLREQCSVQRRTTADIAAELGINAETVRLRLVELGLDRRTDRLSPRLYPNLPDDIRRAVEGPRYGWLRLFRFQQCAGHDTLTAAAKAIGCGRPVLLRQIADLEAAVGKPLLERAATSGTMPMSVTEHGRSLLEMLSRPDIAALLREKGKPKAGWSADDPRRANPPRRSRSRQHPARHDE